MAIDKRGPRRYRARYRGPDGREHSETFERREDAKDWVASQKTKRRRGEWIDPDAGRIV
jgi:hypothetical protein